MVQPDVTTLGTQDLPVEIFNRIVSLLRDIKSPGVDHRDSLGWLNVTHVSRIWRATTLANPSLWTRIPMGIGMNWSRLFFERSHPLSVDVDVVQVTSANPWEDLLSLNFHRIRSYKLISNIQNESEDPTYGLLQQPSEALETLALSGFWRALESPRLESHQYPRLRTLHASLFAMPLDTFPWRGIGNPGLTELKISLGPAIGDSDPLDEIVQTLARLPSLITLALTVYPDHDRIEGGSQVDHGVKHTAHLAKLADLSLKTEGNFFLHFLDRVSFSTSVETSLLVHKAARAIDPSLISSILIPWISQRTGATPTRHLSFTETRNRYVQMTATASLGAGSRAFLLLPIKSSIADAFDEVLQSLGPSGIKAIDIEPILELTRGDTLTRLASACHECTSIRLLPIGDESYYTRAGEVIDTVRQLLTAVTPIERPPFPNLVSLDLTAIDKTLISALYANYLPTNSYPAMPPTLAQGLLDVVEARGDGGGVMPQIYLPWWTAPFPAQFDQVMNALRSMPGLRFVPEGSKA
ncbi:unnamed protein product [Peniophora sp. CBMAI 1063]|nr:unnamed protein product [Peniophora sp. CBMAI 1063]